MPKSHRSKRLSENSAAEVPHSRLRRLAMLLFMFHSDCFSIRPSAYCRGVAQPGSAPGSGPGGRRFKSSRPDHSFQQFGFRFHFIPTVTVAVFVVTLPETDSAYLKAKSELYASSFEWLLVCADLSGGRNGSSSGLWCVREEQRGLGHQCRLAPHELHTYAANRKVENVV